MRFRTIYVLISLPLIAWLLAANLELRYYRNTSLALDVNQITVGLTGGGQYLDRALETFDQRLYSAAIDWLVTVERELVSVETAARGYNAALNRRFSSSQGNYLELDPIVGMYAQEIRSVRQYVERFGELRPDDRALLVDVAVDLRTLQEALPEDLLRRARKDEIRSLVRNLSKSLKVKSVRGWLGA